MTDISDLAQPVDAVIEHGPETTTVKEKPKRIKNLDDAARNLCAKSTKAFNKALKKCLRKKYDIRSAPDFACRFVTGSTRAIELDLRQDVIDLVHANRPTEEKFKREDSNVIDQAHIFYCRHINNHMPDLGITFVTKTPEKVEKPKRSRKKTDVPIDKAIKAGASSKLPKAEKKKTEKKAAKPKAEKKTKISKNKPLDGLTKEA